MNYKKFISTLTKRGFQVYYEYVGYLLGVSINVEELKISVVDNYDTLIVKLYSLNNEVATISTHEQVLLDYLKKPSSGLVLSALAELSRGKTRVIEHSIVHAIPLQFGQRLLPTNKGILLMVDSLKELYISINIPDVHTVNIELLLGSKLLSKREISLANSRLNSLIMTIVTLVEKSAEKYERFMQAEEAGIEYCYEFWKD